ncbi:GNAT family N-acetyltransferase [Nevskia sp.]|uniref:GNAT family N-acetyltransferase n=1 Tax=Nevskia sp. TaxID=1929292 RepID=UPI0025EF041E|nr:GNAT family N-acetyltransferase [Nevskia sp.]
MSTPTTTARLYQPDDRAACLRAFDSNVPKYFDASERDDFEDYLDGLPDRQPGRYFVVVDSSGAVQGSAGYALNERGDSADFCWAMVQREQHRSGYGRVLLEARLAAILAEGKVREVRLSTSQHAAGFYQRFGFVTIKLVPGGFSPGIDRCDMVLALA